MEAIELKIVSAGWALVDTLGKVPAIEVKSNKRLNQFLDQHLEAHKAQKMEYNVGVDFVSGNFVIDWGFRDVDTPVSIEFDRTNNQHIDVLNRLIEHEILAIKRQRRQGVIALRINKEALVKGLLLPNQTKIPYVTT